MKENMVEIDADELRQLDRDHKELEATAKECVSLETMVRTLEEHIAELEAALKPFAEKYGDMSQYADYIALDLFPGRTITVGDCRRAADALKGGK